MAKACPRAKRRRGAPKGNQNARKHGFYSQVLDETDKLNLEDARDMDGLDEEIAIMRVKLLRLISDHPDRIDLQVSRRHLPTGDLPCGTNHDGHP